MKAAVPTVIVYIGKDEFSSLIKPNHQVYWATLLGAERGDGPDQRSANLEIIVAGAALHTK